MTKEKVQEVIDGYKQLLEKLAARPERCQKDYASRTIQEELNHCYWMINKIESFLKDDRIEKAFRWLGFVQGVFWTRSVFTVEQMKNHNRP